MTEIVKSFVYSIIFYKKNIQDVIRDNQVADN